MSGKVLAVGTYQGPLNVFTQIAGEFAFESIECHTPAEALTLLGKGGKSFAFVVIDGAESPTFKPFQLAGAIAHKHDQLPIIYVGDHDPELSKRVTGRGWKFTTRGDVPSTLRESFSRAAL